MKLFNCYRHRKVFRQPTENQATQVCEFYMPPHFLHKCFNFYIGPVPKLSRTPGQLPDVIKDLHAGEHSIEVLQEAGYPQKVYITLKIILCNLKHVYTTGD